MPMDATRDRNHITAIVRKHHRAIHRDRDATATIQAAFPMRVMWIAQVVGVMVLSMSKVRSE